MTKKYNVFLSHSSPDKPTVEQIAQWLQDKAKLSVWLDKWNLIPGEPWQEEIEKALDESECCAVFLGPNGMGPWQNEEMRTALDERVSKQTIRVVPVLLPGAVRPGQETRLPRFLRRLTWVLFQNNWDEEDPLHRLVCGIKGIPPGRDAKKSEADVCPYRGLEVFREKDHDIFFGREAVVQRLMDKLNTSRFLAVLGPSGCGKSSVVQAGLIPHLRDQALVTLFTPREQPIEELAYALRKCYPENNRPPVEQLIHRLKGPEKKLHYIAREALEDTDEKNLVIVIDQFEELFTQTGSMDERKKFILAVLTAVEVAKGPVMAILTMRSDFIGKCAFYPDLNTYVSEHFFQVSPMSQEELRSAIEEPAQLAGIDFETGLVNQILGDIKEAPGELPLLEHALLELYERRIGKKITLQAYDEIGGIEGALVKRAESEFAQLDDEQKEILRKMFVLRLIQPGEGTEDTRRRAAQEELLAVGYNSRVAEDLLVQWTNARLLTIMRDTLQKKNFVDVAHEALIRKWDRLQGWMAEDREESRQIGILRNAAREWKRVDKNQDYLPQGTRLVQMEALLKSHTKDLTDDEKEFVNAGITLREQRVKKEKEKREKELQDAHDLAAARNKAVKRSRAIILVILLSLILSVYFLYKVNEKENIFREKVVKSYWDESQHAREKGEDLKAVHLCAEALSLNSDKQLHQTLMHDMNSYWNPFLLLNIFQHEKAIRGATFNHDGTRILTWSSDDTLRQWDVNTGDEIGEKLVLKGTILGAAFNKDGTLILTWGEDKTARLWDADTGKKTGPILKHDGVVRGATFNHDGKRILTWSADKTARLWRTDTGEQIGSKLMHNGVVLKAKFSQDEKRILTWSSMKIARRWNTKTGKELDPLIEYVGEKEKIKGAAFSDDWTRLLTWFSDHTMRRWDANSNIAIEPIMEHKGAVRGGTFNSDGTRILTWSDDKTARLWDAYTGTQIGSNLVHKEPIRGATFNCNETRILTWSDDKTARLWAVDMNIGKLDISVDWDFPIEKIELQVKALTGTTFDFEKKQINFIDVRKWRKLYKEYMDAAKGHNKNCRYPDANVFYKLFPEASARENK
jgi:WD40 repeat protein/energy-coupling factor transporter ATP-binding protein EcfA2